MQKAAENNQTHERGGAGRPFPLLGEGVKKMEIKSILTIGLCLFILGGLVFLRFKKKNK